MIPEGELIERLRRLFASDLPTGVEGIGDDAAVFPAPGGRHYVVTTDMIHENVDFLRARWSAFDVGRKAMEVNLSDVAAMGALPRFAFVSVGFPAELDPAWGEAFFAGVKESAGAANTFVLGGDLSRSKEIVVNVALVGEAATDELKRRAGGKAGDVLFVTGTVGDSRAGLEILLAGREPANETERELLNRHFRPRAQLREARLLAAEAGVHALMDLSDGLDRDLPKLALASGGLSFAVDLEALPRSEELRAFTRDSTDYAWLGGEDFVLLGSCAPERAAALAETFHTGGLSWTRIGQLLEAGTPPLFRRGDEFVPRPCGLSFTHFPE